MTLDEAIKHAEEVAESRCDKCGQEHKQLAEWLKDYKRLKEQEPQESEEISETNMKMWEEIFKAESEEE